MAHSEKVLRVLYDSALCFAIFYATYLVNSRKKRSFAR